MGSGGATRGGRSPFDQRPQYESRPSGGDYGGFARAMSGGGKARPKASGVSAAPSAAPADFHKGDMVQHKAFGRGMILSIQKMGGDALVEIAFDNVGTKRLMMKSAAAHMTKIS